MPEREGLPQVPEQKELDNFPPEHYEWILPSTLQHSEILDQFVQVLRKFGWPDEDIFGLRLGLHETIINAVKHGNRFDSEKTVEVDYDVSSKEIKIVIRDKGTGFQQEKIPDPLSEEGVKRGSGRGILFAKNFYTSFENRITNRGHEVMLIKTDTRPNN